MKKLALYAVAAVALMGAAPRPAKPPAADPMKFDLVCVGERSDADGATVWKGRVSIDLGRKLARWDDAPSNVEITEATAAKIVFRQPTGHAEIDRSSGEYEERFTFIGNWRERSGKCERAPFTGVAEPKF